MIQYITQMYIEDTTQQTQTKTHAKAEELERDIEYIKKSVVSISHNNYENKIKLGELIRRQVYDLDQLIQYYPERVPYPRTCIFSAIMNDYRMKSVDSHTIRQLYDIFDNPEFDGYKIHVYNTAKRRKDSKVTDQLEQGEMDAINMKVFQTINFIESNIDNPTIHNFIERKAKELVKQTTREKKEKEDEEKETIPTPDFIKGLDGRPSKLYYSILKIMDTFKHIAVRVYRYPPRDERDDIWYSEGIDTLNALLVPGTDLKYVRDTLSYFDISYEKNTQSIHSAMSKSKILTPSGKWRKVTREQIADIDPQIILLAVHTVEKIPGLMQFFLYLMNEQKPYSGDFHLNRHDKLSESAFGNAGFQD